MKPTSRLPARLPAALLGLALCWTHIVSGQVPFIINVNSIDRGFYDALGEHDSRNEVAFTGAAAGGSPRWPARSFMVFEIPEYPGVLTGATVTAYSESIGPSATQTLYLHQVTNSAATVRQAHFFGTNIYADLGDGPVYASHTFSPWFQLSTVTMLGSGLSAIDAARGQEFVVGGNQSPITLDPNLNDYIYFPYSSGWELSLELKLLVPNEPKIYSQPTPSLLFSNDAVVTVGACGAEPLHYSWFVNDLPSGSGLGYRQLYLSSWLTSSNAAVFVVVSNNFGSVTSAVANVVRSPARLSWIEGTNVAVRSGSWIYLPMLVSTPGVFSTFTWLKDGMPFPNSFYNAVSFGDAQPTNSGDYALVVSNSIGVVTSAVMRLQVVDVAPRLWQQPQNTTNALGSFAYFSVEAPAGPAPEYRWFHNHVLIPPTTNTSAFFSLSPVELLDGGEYFVVISNRAGSVTSAVARLEVVIVPPVFTVQPQSQITYPGRVVNFHVELQGEPFPDLQWYFNDTPIPGERYTSLTLSSVSSTNEGNYYCVATNYSGVKTSEVATLTVLAVPPQIAGPNDVIASAGTSLYTSVIVSNPPACVSWFVDETLVPGSISCTPYGSQPFGSGFVLHLGASNYVAQFYAVASNAYGFATSRIASITVTTAPPAFSIQPADITVLEGSTIVIPNLAHGAPTPRLYLYRNGQDAGALYNGSLYLFNVSPAQSGEYTLVASNQYGTATSQPFRISAQRLGPLDLWTRRQPFPQGNDLHGVAHGQGLYVACGSVGTIITSADATNWAVFSAAQIVDLEDVAYGNGRFVCVGDDGITGVIVTSTNGQTWVTQQLPEAARLRGIAFGDGRFLAIGTEAGSGLPRAYVSTNGLEWLVVPVNTASGGTFRAVTHGAGRWVISADSGIAHFSDYPNLTFWTNAFTGVLGSEGAAFVNNRFVVVGNNAQISVSASGATWTQVTNSVTTRRLFNTAFHAGLYVAVGARGTIISSTTAEDLSWKTELSPTPDRLEDIIYAGGLFLAVGENGSILTSYDGLQWIEQTRGVAEDLDDLAVSDNLAIAVGKNGTILTSTNGRSWEVGPLPSGPDAAADWHGVAFGDGKIVVVGQSTNVLVSTDQAATWHAQSFLASASYLKSVAYAQGLWVAVGIGGVIMTSPDATNWTQQPSPVTYDLNDIAYGHGHFVVVGDQFPNPSATILTSTDGTNWINRSYPLGKNARAITFQQNHFVIAANDGRFLVTTNPLAWGPPSLSARFGDGDNHRDVTAHDRIWISVGNRGIIVTAPSTFTNGVGPWYLRQPHTVENLHAVRHFKGTFIAVGNRGVILQSGVLESRLDLERDGSQLRLIFSTPHAGVYTLQESTDFSWSAGEPLNATLGTAEKTVPLDGPRRFFRVVPQ